jgi:hypothetical protein
MKFRHAAALALVGWYLMLPPQRCEDKTRSDLDTCDQVSNLEAPLSAWFRTWPSYPTAQDCEKALEMDRRTTVLNGPDRAIDERERVAARCVSSDVLKGSRSTRDPKLK